MKPGRASAWGALIWLGVVAFTVRGFLTLAWLHALLVFAALVIVPLVLEIAGGGRSPLAGRLFAVCRRAQLPAAVALAAAHVLAPGPLAGCLALPWLAVMTGGAVVGFDRLRRRQSHGVATAGVDLGLVFAAIGAAWAVAERAGWRPLGFDLVIVELTAVHFHYAGLVLTVLAGRAAGRLPHSAFAKFAAWGAVTGVPLVALGITASQLGWGGGCEAAAGGWLALSGGAVAVLHLRLALAKGAPVPVRVLWLVAGGSLLWGMLWAGLYAEQRGGLPLGAPGIPGMWVVHGTVNAFGFALAGSLGWWLEAATARRH